MVIGVTVSTRAIHVLLPLALQKLKCCGWFAISLARARSLFTVSSSLLRIWMITPLLVQLLPVQEEMLKTFEERERMQDALWESNPEVGMMRVGM